MLFQSIICLLISVSAYFKSKAVNAKLGPNQYILIDQNYYRLSKSSWLSDAHQFLQELGEVYPQLILWKVGVILFKYVLSIQISATCYKGTGKMH